MLREHDKSEDPFMIVAGGSSQGASALSDLGCEREFNEDRCGLVQSSNNKTWIVCDGMGGVAGGEVAAQLAIDSMKRYLERDSQDEASADILVQAMREANRVVVLRRQNQAFSAMGTTMVAAFFNRDEVVIGHVGDSRAYLIRDGAVQQITVDHTYVQSLVERGEIQAEEALTHPEAHVLTRCIGADPSLEVDTQRFWLWPNEHADEGDILLLCTDGLYSLVPDVEIGQVAST
ncbi:MAG: protein phosphatase 2C domain-containing protein, partial [Proteobacteria bacterium]|nr:protein phosphatase 2C domain-containing protein [Pseudomonadota bacterium]